MMQEFLFGTIMALWLGILTSISPCPLATNIAAISYIGRRVDRPRQVFLAGLLYTVGRTLVYVVLGFLLVAALLSENPVSGFLETNMPKLLGPILILVAMFLLGLLEFGFAGSGVSEKMQRRVDACGIWGAFLLGIVFALSFCPVSGALFFSLIPISAKLHSSILLPAVYGVGTALPVLLFAVLIAVSAQAVGKAFNRLTQIEWWARRITGIVILAIGLHFSIKHIFEVTPFWDPWVQYVIDVIYRTPDVPGPNASARVLSGL